MRVAVVEIERHGKYSEFILEVERTNGLTAEGMWVRKGSRLTGTFLAVQLSVPYQDQE